MGPGAAMVMTAIITSAVWWLFLHFLPSGSSIWQLTCYRRYLKSIGWILNRFAYRFSVAPTAIKTSRMTGLAPPFTI